ncbi:hypothetical protein CB1_001322008 [Camelus ferus]|nr:hypothetical protein CB1_001322008 [Camelus ferus]
MLHAYHEEQTPVRLIDVKPCILTGQEATLLAGRSPSASPQIQSLSEYQAERLRGLTDGLVGAWDLVFCTFPGFSCCHPIILAPFMRLPSRPLNISTRTLQRKATRCVAGSSLNLSMPRQEGPLGLQGLGYLEPDFHTADSRIGPCKVIGKQQLPLEGEQTVVDNSDSDSNHSSLCLRRVFHSCDRQRDHRACPYRFGAAVVRSELDHCRTTPFPLAKPSPLSRPSSPRADAGAHTPMEGGTVLGAGELGKQRAVTPSSTRDGLASLSTSPWKKVPDTGFTLPTCSESVYEKQNHR